MTISFRTIVRGSLAVFGLAALAGQSANAATVTTIFSTGVLTNDALGNAATFAPGGSSDTHYTVATTGTPGTATANGTPAPAAGGFVAAGVYANNAFPASGPYQPPANSRFVGPPGAIGPQLTYYDFRTTFSLAGFNAATAALTGTVSGDNQVIEIFLNGVAQPFTPNFGLLIAHPQGFTIGSSNFVGGLNTLDFIVFNDSNGSGRPQDNFVAFDADALRLTADVAPTGVPEPGSVAMLIGMSVTGAGFLSRRKRAAK